MAISDTSEPGSSSAAERPPLPTLWHGVVVRRFLYLSLRYRYDMRSEMYVEDPSNDRPEDFYPPVLVTDKGEWCEPADLLELDDEWDPDDELDDESELEVETELEAESEPVSQPEPPPPPPPQPPQPRGDAQVRDAQGDPPPARHWPGIPRMPLPANDGWNQDLDEYGKALFQV